LALVVSEIKRVNGSKEGPTPKIIYFLLKSKFIQFYLLISFEKFLSGLWQQICCIFYHFRDLRGQNVLLKELKINIGPYVKSIKYFFLKILTLIEHKLCEWTDEWCRLRGTSSFYLQNYSDIFILRFVFKMLAKVEDNIHNVYGL
jgi:hypothetical protein